MAGFVYHQIRRGDAAALPGRIMRRRSVIAGGIFMMSGNSTGSVLEYYLPTYYQVIRGYTPAASGDMMLPIIVGGTIGVLIHGIHTALVQLILYTAFSGLGYGLGFSGPQNAVQTVLASEDVPLGASIMLFTQSFGPAVAVAIAQVLFLNRLSTNLDGLVPGLTGAQIESIGLSEMVSRVPAAQSRQALEAIDQSLIQTWYLVVGLACVTMVGSLLMEWQSVRSRRD
ncbi:hypothetical protein BO78DRAFT_408740 [Aspergillus sclerotiicarbonarius CBS 121057]|uniref:MFS general substrate transporter n=1 Tax=Aspergillus sclerotiicarbonarius (strain CBS 121057 / IBT 28362) TaxID=1448318 RepID=A0A319E3T0_ASPSB|nr:hypothetical protein BO78DRAFT_408740 [Aspergillus sclerotiicarbonarius CBS 121057]